MKLDIESGEQFSSSFSSKSRIKQAKMKLWTPFMTGTAFRPLHCCFTDNIKQCCAIVLHFVVLIIFI
jgi:hypothetical protein